MLAITVWAMIGLMGVIMLVILGLLIWGFKSDSHYGDGTE